MEVPWWAIVLFLFVPWNDANSRNKAEASILPQFTKLHQNIENESAQTASESISNFETTSVLARPIIPQELISQQGVIHQQASASIDVQNPFRSLLICNGNPGLAISQQQSAVAQEDVPQGAISASSASANIQRSLASNKQEQSSRLVCANPTVPAKKHTPIQETTKRTEIVTKAQIFNPVVSNNAQQSSNIRTLPSEIRPFDGLQSSGPNRSVSSSNSLNSNIGSVQTILSESNSMASVFPCAVSAAPLSSSDLKSPKAISPLSITPINSYSHPAVINNFGTTSELARPIIPQELISEQGAIHQQASASIDVQNPCRTLFICNANPGLAISQQQSAVAQNDIPQGAISSTSASANIQRSLASNKQEQSSRLVCANPTVPAKKHTPIQETTKRTEIVTKAQIFNPVVSNNAQQSSNIRTLPSEIRPFDGLQSSGPYRSAPSSNSLNSNIGSVQTILSESNSMASVFPCAVSAAPLASSDLKSPKAISPLSIIPFNSYSYPAVINPFLTKSQLINYVPPAVVLPEIRAPVNDIPSCDTPLFWLANVNPFLTNLPASNYGENYINKPVATYVFPIHSSSQKIVDSEKTSTAVNNIAKEICYQPKVNPTSCNVQPQSLSSKSEVVQSSLDNSSLQSSAHSDVSSPVSSIYTNIPNPLAEESLYPSLDSFDNKVDVQTSVQTTQEITSRPLMTESVDSVSRTVSTAKDVIVQSSDSGFSTASVNSNVNIAPTSFSNPIITFVASAPSVPTSATPVCTPSVTPSFGGYPPIQPIIIEDSNSKTRNWLPVILASLIIDNGCSGSSGGYCTGSCNCGTQYSSVPYQTPLYNNLNPYNGRRGSKCNCKTRDQSNSVIIIEIDSDNTEFSDSSDDCDTDNSVDAQASDDTMTN